MKQKTLGGWWIAVLVTAILAAGFVARAGDDDEVVIVGTVVAAQWDDEGNPIEIEIETEHGVYPVILYGAGAELVDYVGEVVSVRGILYTNDDGETILRVDSFTELDDEEA